MDWKIFVAAAGFGGTALGIQIYRDWKASRPSIPMSRLKDGSYVPDRKLGIFERSTKIFVILAICCFTVVPLCYLWAVTLLTAD